MLRNTVHLISWKVKMFLHIIVWENFFSYAVISYEHVVLTTSFAWKPAVLPVIYSLYMAKNTYQYKIREWFKQLKLIKLINPVRQNTPKTKRLLGNPRSSRWFTASAWLKIPIQNKEIIQTSQLAIIHRFAINLPYSLTWFNHHPHLI